MGQDHERPFEQGDYVTHAATGEAGVVSERVRGRTGEYRVKPDDRDAVEVWDESNMVLVVAGEQLAREQRQEREHELAGEPPDSDEIEAEQEAAHARERDAVVVIEADHYREDRERLKADPVVQAMAAEIPAEVLRKLRHEGDGNPTMDLMMLANTGYQARAGKSPEAHIGGVAEAICALADEADAQVVFAEVAYPDSPARWRIVSRQPDGWVMARGSGGQVLSFAPGQLTPVSE